jgi:hypothetical protein
MRDAVPTKCHSWTARQQQFSSGYIVLKMTRIKEEEEEVGHRKRDMKKPS